MSDVRKAPWPVAVCASDLHIWHVPPISRSNDKWDVRLIDYFGQAADIANKLQVPFIVAGDIFHKWNAPAEAILLAIKCLEQFNCRVFAIPGQHDLPYHNQELSSRKSGYEVLCRADIIHDITTPLTLPGTHVPWPVTLHPGRWGRSILPLDKATTPRGTHVLVAHRYIWTSKGNSHPKAHISAKLTGDQLPWRLKGYHAAVFGDNHKGFFAKVGRTEVMNCGTFVCRNIDEKNYKPRVGVLYADGTFKPKYINTKHDAWLDATTSPVALADSTVDAFVESLKGLKSTSFSIPHQLRLAINKIDTTKPFGVAMVEILEHLEK